MRIAFSDCVAFTKCEHEGYKWIDLGDVTFDKLYKLWFYGLYAAAEIHVTNRGDTNNEEPPASINGVVLGKGKAAVGEPRGEGLCS